MEKWLIFLFLAITCHQVRSYQREQGTWRETDPVFFQLRLVEGFVNTSYGYYPVLYDAVDASYPDNLYNMETGRLSFPVSGLFQFDVVCHNGYLWPVGNYEAHLMLMVDETAVTATRVDRNNGPRPLGARAMAMNHIQYVEEGTEVWVQRWGGDTYGLRGHDGEFGCTFTGLWLSGTITNEEPIFFQLVRTQDLAGWGNWEVVFFQRADTLHPEGIYNPAFGKLFFPVSGYFKFDFNCGNAYGSTFDYLFAWVRLIVGDSDVVTASRLNGSWDYYTHVTMSAIRYIPAGTPVHVESYDPLSYGIAGHSSFTGCTFSGYLIPGTAS